MRDGSDCSPECRGHIFSRIYIVWVQYGGARQMRDEKWFRFNATTHSRCRANISISGESKVLRSLN